MNTGAVRKLAAFVLAATAMGCRTAVPLTPAHVSMGNVPVGESAVFSSDPSLDFPPFTRVVARPELYHGKRISLIGFMNLEFEGNALYRTEEEYRRGQTAEGIWIDVDGMTVKPPFARGWVIVWATFNGEQRGHFGSYVGTLEKITRLDRWPIRRRPPNQPLQPTSGGKIEVR